MLQRQEAQMLRHGWKMNHLGTCQCSVLVSFLVIAHWAHCSVTSRPVSNSTRQQFLFLAVEIGKLNFPLHSNLIQNLFCIQTLYIIIAIIIIQQLLLNLLMRNGYLQCWSSTRSIRNNYGQKLSVRVRSKVGNCRTGPHRVLSSKRSNGMGK